MPVPLQQPCGSFDAVTPGGVPRSRNAAPSVALPSAGVPAARLTAEMGRDLGGSEWFRPPNGFGLIPSARLHGSDHAISVTLMYL